MKKIFIIFLTLSYFGFNSCVSNTKNEEKTRTEKSSEKKICDEFIAEYEDIMNEYLNVIDEYFNNPSDETIVARYMELMQEALELSEKWEQLVECADDKEFKDKFEAISDQVENKLLELGL